jgi:choline dehydrogenase-like flavoprotein
LPEKYGAPRETSTVGAEIRRFDVCVVGSGPAGGILAKELAESGAKVALLEAGRLTTPEEFNYHAWPYEFPRRIFPTPGYPSEVTESIRYDNCDDVQVDRIRVVGGRSIHWNAVCLRFAERDFRERSLQGIEEDWPLSYQELAPYYSYVEKMIGVTGSRENLDIVPDGEFLPPLKLRCSEEILKRACAKMGVPLIPTRKALLTRPYDDRPPCHYCGHCMRGCDVGAIFSVPTAILPKAEKTGNFTLIQNKLAREILMDRAGSARAVAVVDTVTRKEEEIQARVFAVCCGAIEGPRLLLNSRSPRFPDGIANSSGLVGRYLGGHGYSTLLGYLEELAGTKPVNNDGAMDHAFIPSFNHLGRKKQDFVGGCQYPINFMGFMFPYQANSLKGFGKDFKEQVRTLQPGFIHVGPWCKVLAKPENYVAVDRSHVDAYGIPIPVVHFRFCENDRALVRAGVENVKEMLHLAKARLVIDSKPESENDGFGSHETGTTRMGNDPRTSVLNSFCRSHDVKNLFVVSGSCFTTTPEKNPTHTIMALAVRTARHIASKAKEGNLRTAS